MVMLAMYRLFWSMRIYAFTSGIGVAVGVVVALGYGVGVSTDSLSTPQPDRSTTSTADKRSNLKGFGFIPLAFDKALPQL